MGGMTPGPSGGSGPPSGIAYGRRNVRLPPEVNRILYVRNLPYKISADELYDIFGKYGSLRQIRRGNGPETRGTAFVCYDDIYDAKNAMDHLSGFNVAGRYLVLLYYNPSRMSKIDEKSKRDEIDRLKRKYGVS
uniref:RRM domain-containing protein n=1 Tax=Noctiluca scintillans TaxID=2966 RepID=A0A7S1FFB6_NOCSC